MHTPTASSSPRCCCAPFEHNFPVKPSDRLGSGHGKGTQHLSLKRSVWHCTTHPDCSGAEQGSSSPPLKKGQHIQQTEGPVYARAAAAAQWPSPHCAHMKSFDDVHTRSTLIPVFSSLVQDEEKPKMAS